MAVKDVRIYTKLFSIKAMIAMVLQQIRLRSHEQVCIVQIAQLGSLQAYSHFSGGAF